MELTVPKISIPKIEVVKIPEDLPSYSLGGLLPGCNAFHRDANRNPSLLIGDKNGVTTSCEHGEAPSYDPINYNPGEITLIESPPPITEEEDKPDQSKPTVPKIAIPDIKGDIPCPRPDDLPIFSKNKLQTHRIIGYQVVDSKCEQVLELLPILNILDNYLPAPSLITTTSTVIISGVFVTAYAKDYLLKALKPAIKKISKKIASMRGKTKILSLSERRKEQRSLRS